jgi:hypothetical protein
LEIFTIAHICKRVGLPISSDPSPEGGDNPLERVVSIITFCDFAEIKHIKGNLLEVPLKNLEV